MRDRPFTDAERISLEDQARARAADEQLRAKISAGAYHIAESAQQDAREASGRIVKHMWIIFVLLPIVLALLFALLTAR